MINFMKRMSFMLAFIFLGFVAYGQTSCFSEDFSDITGGSSTSTGGSSSQWTGNTNFPTVVKAYQAGGAVRLGNTTNPRGGSIESATLDNISGDITVVIMVKGWTNVEGTGIKVSIDGKEAILTYSATLADPFEEVSASFTGITANSKLTIETTGTSTSSNQRCFIDNVEIICSTVAPATCEDVTNLLLTDNNDGTFTATWDGSTSTNEGYYFMINGENSGYFKDGEITGTTFTSEALTDDNYEFFIATICDDANDIVSDGVIDDITIGNAPAILCDAPTNLDYTDNNNGTITITWDEPNPIPAYDYAIFIVAEGDNPDISNINQAQDGTYTTDSLENGNYTIYLTSVCNVDPITMTLTTSDTLTTDFTINIQVVSTCEDVTNLDVTNPSGTDVMLSWTASATAADGYAVVVFDENDVALDTLVTPNTFALYTNNLSDGEYTFVVYAICDASTDEWSDGVNGTIILGTPNTATCEDITDLELVDNGDGTFTATWTASATAADGYYIIIEGNNTDYFHEEDITGTSYTSEELDTDDYSFVIISLCDDDSESDGVQDFVNVENTPTVAICDEPSNVSVTDNNDGTMTITWNAPADAPANYGVVIVEEGETPNLDDAEIVSSTTFITDSLADGNYNIYIFSVCDLDDDLISDEVSANGTVNNTVGLTNLNIISAVYPNPTHAVLNVETNATEGNITITNMMGQTIENVTVTNNVTSFNVTHLPAGVYQVIFTSNEGKMVARFIKE